MNRLECEWQKLALRVQNQLWGTRDCLTKHHSVVAIGIFGDHLDVRISFFCALILVIPIHRPVMTEYLCIMSREIISVSKIISVAEILLDMIPVVVVLQV